MDAPFTAAVVQRFERLEYLGEDPWGPVWGGLDRKTNRLVRVRALAGAGEEVARVVREASVLSHVAHLNLDRVLEAGPGFGSHPGYLMIEHAEGETLAMRMAAARVSLEESLVIGEQLASALGAVHGVGLVHGTFGGAAVTYLGSGAVKVGAVGLGAPGEPAGDQLALGLVLYELVAGRAPAAPLDLARDAPGVPADVVAAVMRAVADAPADRFPTMQELAEALRIAHARLTGAPLTASPRTGLAARRGFFRMRRRGGTSSGGRSRGLPWLPVSPTALAVMLGTVLLVSAYSIVNNLAGTVLGGFTGVRKAGDGKSGGGAPGAPGNLGGAIAGGSVVSGTSPVTRLPRGERRPGRAAPPATPRSRAPSLSDALVGRGPDPDCRVPGPAASDEEWLYFVRCRMRAFAGRIGGSRP